MPIPLRAAVIGTGFIGRVHVRCARLAGAEVIGVAASSPERSAEAARSLQVPRAVASGLEAARDQNVDVIHICTPNSYHLEVAQAALESGKHVLCEKALATSLPRRDRSDRARRAHRPRGHRRPALLPAGHAEGWGDCFEAFVRDSYAAMRGECHSGLPTSADGARSMSIVEAVLRSSASNQWTAIS